jgi:hypothetical protein
LNRCWVWEDIGADFVARDSGDPRDHKPMPGRHALPFLDGIDGDVTRFGDGSPELIFSNILDDGVTLRHRVFSFASDQVDQDAGEAAR